MSKPLIVVVDDDPQVLSAIVRDVRSEYGEHFRIRRASSGPEGLELLDALQQAGEHVALIISDQRMPGMDGVAFLEKAKTLYPQAKRTLLTAYSDTEAAIDAINLVNLDHYFVKPWDPPEDKLYPVVDGLLRDWRHLWRPGFDGLRVVADRWSARSHQIRDYLARNLIPYSFLDVEASDEARSLRREAELPLVIFEGGDRVSNPSEREIAERLGKRTSAQGEFYDLAVVGGGPAGLATAVYGGSEGLTTVLIEQSAPGGQAGTSSLIENYLGFPNGLSGSELTGRAVAQAEKFNVEILSPRTVSALTVDGPYRHLEMEDGSRLSCHALLLAMGVSWRRLPADGADALTDRGVYYGAALTEVDNCANQVVYTVGAGNSAGQAAMRFAEKAARVVMLVRGDSLEAKMSQYLVDRIHSTDNIEVRLHTSVIGCEGDHHLERLRMQNSETGEARTEDASYLFVFIGARPHTEWLGDVIACDDHGFILTGPDLREEHLQDWPLERDPYLLETNVPGVFAAGDVRHESVKRVASAVGEGSVSVHFVHRHLAAL
ncbi:MAG: FAD-dependent oxidoreductase [Rhodothermales bacterium]|nr:FAD-dependent oxidoreductase [Rhodothermales bacterium]MBO6778040.1 FAD-dependent oxidoreductase [Rhodothermales bacterium]